MADYFIFSVCLVRFSYVDSFPACLLNLEFFSYNVAISSEFQFSSEMAKSCIFSDYLRGSSISTLFSALSKNVHFSAGMYRFPPNFSFLRKWLIPAYSVTARFFYIHSFQACLLKSGFFSRNVAMSSEFQFSSKMADSCIFSDYARFSNIHSFLGSPKICIFHLVCSYFLRISVFFGNGWFLHIQCLARFFCIHSFHFCLLNPGYFSPDVAISSEYQFSSEIDDSCIFSDYSRDSPISTLFSALS